MISSSLYLDSKWMIFLSISNVKLSSKIRSLIESNRTFLLFYPRSFQGSEKRSEEKKGEKDIIVGGFFRHPVERMVGLTQESYLFHVGPEPRRQSYGINTLTYSFSKLLSFQFVPLSSSLYGRAAFRTFVRDILSNYYPKGTAPKRSWIYNKRDIR